MRGRNSGSSTNWYSRIPDPSVGMSWAEFHGGGLSRHRQRSYLVSGNVVRFLLIKNMFWAGGRGICLAVGPTHKTWDHAEMLHENESRRKQKLFPPSVSQASVSRLVTVSNAGCGQELVPPMPNLVSCKSPAPCSNDLRVT